MTTVTTTLKIFPILKFMHKTQHVTKLTNAPGQRWKYIFKHWHRKYFILHNGKASYSLTVRVKKKKKHYTVILLPVAIIEFL